MSTTPGLKVRNWSADNRALVERGSLTVWIDEDALTNWMCEKDPKKIGRPFVSSDAAVELVLTLREMYHLPLRAAQGFAASILHALGVTVPVPHYSTLSRRAARLAVDLGATAATGPRVILMDSTGLKVYGEGEWKVRQHGYSKRRTWRKLHLAIDAGTHEVVACETTGNDVTDAAAVPGLMDDITGEVGALKADGAYDQGPVYDVLDRRGATPVIPPRRNAVIHKHGNAAGPPDPRDENVRGVRRHGRKEWKRRVGYHERSLAETAMFRVKTMFGGGLRHRTLEAQRVECRIKCRIMNRMTRLGLLARAA
jgi:hypothetical protein